MPPGIGPSGPIQPSVPFTRLRDARAGVGAERELLDALELVRRREIQLEVAGHVLLAHDAAIGALEAHRLERRDLGVAADAPCAPRRARPATSRRSAPARGGSRRCAGAAAGADGCRGLGRGRLGEAQAGGEEGRRDERGEEGVSAGGVGRHGRSVCRVWAGVESVRRPRACVVLACLGRLDVAPTSIVVVRRRRMVNGALRLC